MLQTGILSEPLVIDSLYHSLIKGKFVCVRVSVCARVRMNIILSCLPAIIRAAVQWGLLVREQTIHDVSAAYMCSAPHTGRSNRQAHVVPLSSSIPQVSARGWAGHPWICGLILPSLSAMQRALPREKRQTLRREKAGICLCCSKCCTIEEVLNFMACFAGLLSSWYEWWFGLLFPRRAKQTPWQQ